MIFESCFITVWCDSHSQNVFFYTNFIFYILVFLLYMKEIKKNSMCSLFFQPDGGICGLGF